MRFSGLRLLRFRRKRGDPGQAVPRVRHGGETPSWRAWQAPTTTIACLPNPAQVRTIPDVRLFAIVGTWMEEDIIASTVANAFTQGCERVYLVDNSSPDATVAVACAQGAILARNFETPTYDETIRIQQMNAVVHEVSQIEPDEHLWWLFLDADEFPHGPFGLTVLEFLRTLDIRFRVVGARFLDHYPSTVPSFLPGRHPLDFQPLCEELCVPMCSQGHRKHPLVRIDKNGAPINADRGFHQVLGAPVEFEPEHPIVLHHFPFREEHATRGRLRILFEEGVDAKSRADLSSDSTTHMYARMRSLDAVYRQDWENVVNFLASDPMYVDTKTRPRETGVQLDSWRAIVGFDHLEPLRWYSMLGAWDYETLPELRYGDDASYIRGMMFLDGHGVIEDWGCGFRHASKFVSTSAYVGVDGSSPWADKRVDLREYTTEVDCIFMRHVLEHNADWSILLRNALASFGRRMVLVIFTPFGSVTRQIATSNAMTNFAVPDISFNRDELVKCFESISFYEESIRSDTQYGVEHIFYLERTDETVQNSE